jgi:hypothetical protein
MNEQISRQALDILGATANADVPPEIRALAEEGVAKARVAFTKCDSAARTSVKVLEDIVLTTQKAAKTLGEKVIGNALANTEATLDAAEKLARARTLPEAAQIQAGFVQDRLVVVGEQNNEFIELSVNLGRQVAEAVTATAERAIGDLKALT